MAKENRSVADELMEFIKETTDYEPRIESGPSIRRVPNEFLEGNEKYYKPRAVPIGPLHAAQEQKDGIISNYVVEMKKSHLQNFLTRLRPNITKEKLIQKLTDSESEARKYYEGHILLSSYEFLRIMLLDGCYILELLYSQDWKTTSLIMSQQGGMPLYNLQQDLLKLENQLPFFILQSLHEMIKLGAHNQQSLVESILSFFSVSLLAGCKLVPAQSEEIRTQMRIKHLLHLVMIVLFPSRPAYNHQATSSYYYKTRSASELAAHGVKFRKKDGVFLSDIGFRNGVLEIPQLTFQEPTASLFSNLLVLELYSEELHTRLFSSYVMFIGSLISNRDDVEVLIQAGIIKTRVHDISELVSFFSNLTANVIINPRDFCFTRQQQQMDGYCNAVGPRLHATVMRVYFEAKWDALTSILVFILTVTQTLFSVLAYSPKKN